MLERERAVPSIVMVWSMVAALGSPRSVAAAVPTGTEVGARRYYASTATAIGFSKPEAIFETTLDDMACYLGYCGLTGADLQDLPPSTLMNPDTLLAPCQAESNVCPRQRDALLAAIGPVPPRPRDILVARFFAPKIMNIDEPQATR